MHCKQFFVRFDEVTQSALNNAGMLSRHISDDVEIFRVLAIAVGRNVLRRIIRTFSDIFALFLGIGTISPFLTVH